jgi:hypothetical protein
MIQRFKPGDTVIAKDGKSYIVEVIDGDIVYCAAPGGGEMEFPQSGLFTAAEWASRADGRRDAVYAKLRQSRVYTAMALKLDGHAASQLLSKADRLTAGLLDYVAYTTAVRILTDSKDGDLVAGLSIIKAREIFDSAKPEIRASLLAEVLFTDAPVLINAAGLGDNLLRALIDKGIAAHGESFEDFCDRPRK